jgi:SAM-dependent methyltransferase
MDPRETGRKYDSIAEDWLKPHLQSNGLAALQRAIEFTITRGHALEVGCGCSGRFIEHLLEYEFAIEALDVSERMIELARPRQPAATYHVADIRSWDFPRAYDFISAWDCLWHVPISDQAQVHERILRALAPGGVFLFTMGGLDEPGEKTDAFMGPTMYYSTLGIPRMLEALAAAGCVCRHLEFDQRPEAHLVVIAQKLVRA